MLTRRRLVISAAMLVCTVIVLGLPLRRERSVVFEQVSTRRTPLQRVLVYLGAEVTDPASDYPASLFTTFDTECSATLVGLDTLLTAAHCAKWSPQVSLRINGVDIGAGCTASEMDDIALCKLGTDVNGIVFDVIERNTAMAAIGRSIRLTGWADPPASNAFARWLRRLRRLLGFGSAFKRGTGTITASSNALLTVNGNMVNAGQVVLEPGDSGGAGYAEEASTRTIIGVNKCGGAFCATGATAATSVLTDVTDSSVADWIMTWAVDNGASVCGFTSTVACRP